MLCSKEQQWRDAYLTRRVLTASLRYSPPTSRWLTRDPLGMVDGPNLYGYVGDSPIHRLDVGGGSWLTDLPLGCYASALVAIHRYGGSSDDYLHCMVSCVLTRDCLFGSFEAFMSGTVKEILDILFYGTRDSADDLRADIVGISIGRSGRKCDSDHKDCSSRCNDVYPRRGGG